MKHAPKYAYKHIIYTSRRTAQQHLTKDLYDDTGVPSSRNVTVLSTASDGQKVILSGDVTQCHLVACDRVRLSCP